VRKSPSDTQTSLLTSTFAIALIALYANPQVNGVAGRRAKSFLLVSGCLTDSRLVGPGERAAWCAG